MLTLAQRLQRLQVRTEELEFWRTRRSQAVDSWTFDASPIALGAAWPRSEGIAHFAADIRVPDGWALEDTRLVLDLGGESLLTFQADAMAPRCFGLDPFHRELAVPAAAFRVSSDTVARLLFGEPVRAPRLERADLLWLEPDVDRLWLLLRQLAEAIVELEGHEVVPHLLDAGEEALRGLDWPSATAHYVSRTAMAPMQQKIWRLPDLQPGPESLSDDQRATVSHAHAALLDRLARLRERFPPRGKVALTGHAHIDLAWLWPYDETRRKLRRTFHTVLSLIESSPDFRFNQSTAHYYAQLEEDDPALLAKIVDRSRAGQWETLGGMWVEPDTNMPTGESFARQILYGQRYFERVFGVRHTICWLPDCFGFSGALPQLLVQGGMRSFFTIKVNWSETNHIPADLFWWEGLDGSRVLAHTFDNGEPGYNGAVRPDALVRTWKNFRQKDKHDTTLLCVGHGDGGGGPTPEMLQRERQLRVFPALPEARWTRVSDFFDAAHATASQKDLQVWRGEIYLEAHRGTLTSQSAIKRLHRRAERAVITAETLACLAHLLGAVRPRSMESDWRVVLKNEFHDILPGSSIAEVCVDARRELEDLIAKTEDGQRRTMERLLAELPAGRDGHVLVFNPSLSERPLRLDLPEGVVAAEGTIPPLGIVVLPETALAAKGGLTATDRVLENDILRVELADDGSIASILHKPSDREAIEGGANRLFAYPADKPRNWDAWDIEEDYDAKAEEITALESRDLVENGPHRASIRLVRRWRHSTIVQTLSLCANARRLDIHTHLDWHDRRVLLRTETGVAVRSARATFECACGIVERPTHTNTSWDAAMFEAPAHRFVDLAEPGFGVALLNNAKYGHSARGNRLGLSLLRAPIYPDPLADEGEQAFTYALMPHAGSWDEAGVLAEADDLDQPLLACPAAGRAVGRWRPVQTRGVAAALSAIKPSEDGDDLVFRVYEPAGRRGAFTLSLPEGWTAEGPLSILEELMPDLPPGRLHPFEVRSWRLRRRTV